MFKRKLFKRALPFILSVAMMFESLPATAMATESSGAEQMTETERQSEEGGEERSGSESEESAEAASTEERLSEESSGSESGSESEEAPTSEESSGSESGSESEASTPSGSETPSTSEEWSESGSESETPSTSEESSGSEHADEREEIEQKEVDAEETKLDTKLEIKQEAYAGINEIRDGAGNIIFQRDLSKDDPTYTTQYNDPSKCGELQDKIEGNVTVVVNDQTINEEDLDPSMKLRFKYEWKGKKADTTGTDDPYANNVDGFPKDAGEYRLRITVEAVDTLCKEAYIDVYVTINPADLTLDLDTKECLNINPGKTVADLQKQITEEYVLKYKDGSKVIDDKTKVVAENGVKVDIKKSGEEEALAPETKLDTDAEYIAVISFTLLDAVKNNYTVGTENFYIVKVGDLVETKIDVKVDNELPIIETYDTEPVVLADVVKLTQDYPKVMIKGKDSEEFDEELKLAEGETVEAGWYRREQVAGDAPNADEITDTTVRYDKNNDKQQGYRYVKLDVENPTDAGDYYVIWKYAGDEGKAYKKSVSEPLAVTIKPAPVVITVTDSAETLQNLFRERMSQEELNRAYAQINYNVSKVGADGKVDAANNVKDSENFFGTTYGADAEGGNRCYNPVFELQRGIKSKIVDGKATDVTDDKEKDWHKVTDKDLIKSDDMYVYEYRLIITGEKAVYNTAGGVDNKVSITELSTDSANRNYLVATDSKTLAENAAKVELQNAKDATIDTSAIVEAFTGKGTLEEPAVKIYDEKPLFDRRGDYKKATVTGVDNTALSSDDLTYTWRKVNLETYEAYMKESATEKEKQPLNDRNIWSNIDYEDSDKTGGTNETDGTLIDTIDSDFYELKVEYKDPTGAYYAKPATVYFKVEKQEIVIVVGEQIAQNGRRKTDWEAGRDGTAGLDKTTYKVYRVPENDFSKYDGTSELNLEETRDTALAELFASYADFGNNASADDPKLGFVVQNQEKNADGTNNANKYVDTMHDVFDKDAYVYGVIARYIGRNYTTVDKDVKDEVKHNEVVSPIKFLGEGVLYTKLDKAAIEKMTKMYDGEPIVLPAEGFIKLYSDEAMTDANDVTAAMLNAYGEYDPSKVSLYWRKISLDGQGNIISYDNIYTTPNAVWGGSYVPVLRFKGDENYKPINVSGVNDELNGETYGEWKTFNEKDYIVTIKPIDITITPQLKETNITAGDTVDSLRLDTDLSVVRADGSAIPEKDQIFFNYAELTSGVFDEFYKSGVLEEKDNTLYAISKLGGYPAYCTGTSEKPSYQYQINDNGKLTEIKNADSECLRYGRTYTVRLKGDLAEPLKSSYNVTYGAVERKVEERGLSNVRAADDVKAAGKGIRSIPLKYEYSNGTYSVKPREAVPYYYNKVKVGDVEAEGNYIAYNVYAPKEFLSSVDGEFVANSKKFILAESVKAAGGEIIGATYNTTGDGEWTIPWNSDQYGRYITVLFPVTEDAKERAFTITWEEGYTETFTLTDVELEADLKQAVAPKSLKFNGVQTKMAVGETQQLDVKITKKQLGDVIKLQYRIVGPGNQTSNDFISIDPDTGVVTARHTQKKATTQVEAYPVYRDKDGNLVEITGKGVKTAKTKITVTDLAAPSVKKVVTTDTKADVYYTVPANGYRREIYVIEAKKAKADVFESNIANVKNGRYTEAGFAVAPTFVYPATETANYDTKTKQTKVTINGLTAGKNYVVYVRNVSQARTLDDGTSVDLAFKGGVKNFLATKSQLRRLIPYFNVNSSNTPDKKNPVTHPVTINPDGTETIWDKEYEIDLLFSKSAQLALKGWFIEKESYGDAEDKDRREYDLPLTKDLQATYLNPKLTYGVFDTDDYGNPWGSGVEASKYATISKKGKLTIKGTDWNGAKTIYIYVKADNEVVGSVPLTIVSEVDSVVGKKARLKVGDDKPLSDFLEYKQGKKKVPNYRSSKIMITDEVIQAAADAGYKIYDVIDEHEEMFDGNGDWANTGSGSVTNEKNQHHIWYIKAVSPNKKPFALDITDHKSNGEPMTAKVTLTSAPIEAVKGLKVSYVDDKNITISFKHAGKPQGFEVEVLDARNSVIQKKFVPNNVVKGMYTYVSATAPAYEQNREKWNLNHEYGDSLVYFEKTKNYAYTISNDKLLRRSSYTVKVTPVYENQRPKTVSKKFKTTDIPAARYTNLDVWGDNVKGGIDVIYLDNSHRQVNAQGETTNWDEIQVQLWGKPFFTAGNTYTLQAWPESEDAKVRVTDTLTWKSSNTKVATIKSRPGTYTATMKAVKSGTTTITVTSKITKKVIARYDIMVKATGNGDGFGGDFEQAEDDNFYKNVLAVWDPFYEGRLEVLSVANPITVNAKSEQYDRTWVTFTAPAFGEYSFVKANGDGRVEFFYANGDKISSEDHGISAGDLTETVSEARLVLEQGQKIYMRAVGSFTLSVVESTSYAILSAANNAENALEVKANEWVTFTAPEDNYYSFGPANVIDAFRFNNQPKEATGVPAGDKVTFNGKEVDTKAYSLKAGETLFIKTAAKGKLFVEYRKLSRPDMELDLKARPTVKPELKLDNLTEYVKFTAPTTNRYDFVTKVTKNVEVTVYDADGNTDYFGKDINIVPKNAVAQLNAEGDEAEKPEEKTTTLYMQAGQTIIFKFTVIGGKDGFKDDKLDENGKETFNKKAEAEVTVSAPEIKSIEPNKDDTIGKEKVATYTFTIPKDAKNVTYTFKVEGTDAETTYLDSKGKKLNAIDTITVDKDSEVSGISYAETKEAKTFKTGDTIYVVVKASKDADAKLSVTSAAPKAIEADKSDSIKVQNDSGSFWYTFTATADGVYEFGAEAKDNEAPADTHEVGISGVATVEELKVGETKEFFVNVTKEVTEPDPNKVTTTDVTVFVKTRKAEPAVAENTVSLAKGETKYYKYTVMATDTYTFDWKQNDDAKGSSSANQDTSLAGSFSSGLNKNKELKAGEVVYIKISENGTDTAGGKLTITAKNASSENLKSGTASSYKLKANESKTFKFTAPTAQTTDAEKYSITVTVPKYDEKAENPVNVVPTVTVVDADGEETTPTSVASSNTEGLYVMEVALKKSETVLMTLSVDTDAEGTILVQPRTPAEPKTITSTGDDKVSASKNAYYKFTAPKYGRYHFEVVSAENNNAVISAVKKNSSKEYINRDFVVLNEGDDLYITVSTSAVTDQTAPLKVAEVAPETISAVDTEFEVTIPANSYKFYKLEAPAHALYTFGTTEVTAGSPSVNLYNMKTNKPLSSYTLDQKDEVLVVMKASFVETKFKYKVSKKDITMLTADGTEKSVDLKTGESAVFEFPVQNADMYVFEIKGKVTHDNLVPVGRTAAEATAVNRHNGTTENGHYIVNEYDKTAMSETFTVTATEDTKVSVKVTKAVVETLTADAAEKTIEINEGECRFVKFIPTARGRYTLTTGDNVSGGFNDVVLAADAQTYKLRKLEVTGSPESKQATAKVKVTTVKPEPISATKTFKAPAQGAVWFEFTAPNNAKYEFVVNDKDNKVFVANVEKYAVIDDNNSTVNRSVMAKGDKVIIKVPSGAAAKDTDLTLDVKETKPVSDKTFWDVKFNGALYPVSFEVEKDETYIVTIARKGDEKTTYEVDAFIVDEESENGRKTLGTASLGEESKITIAPQKEKATVNLEIKVAGSQSDNSNVLVIVEKVEKKTEDKPQQPDEGTTTPDDNTPKPEA